MRRAHPWLALLTVALYLTLVAGDCGPLDTTLCKLQSAMDLNDTCLAVMNSACPNSVAMTGGGALFCGAGLTGSVAIIQPYLMGGKLYLFPELGVTTFIFNGTGGDVFFQPGVYTTTTFDFPRMTVGSINGPALSLYNLTYDNLPSNEQVAFLPGTKITFSAMTGGYGIFLQGMDFTNVNSVATMFPVLQYPSTLTFSNSKWQTNVTLPQLTYLQFVEMEDIQGAQTVYFPAATTAYFVCVGYSPDIQQILLPALVTINYGSCITIGDEMPNLQIVDIPNLVDCDPYSWLTIGGAGAVTVYANLPKLRNAGSLSVSTGGSPNVVYPALNSTVGSMSLFLGPSFTSLSMPNLHGTLHINGDYTYSPFTIVVPPLISGLVMSHVNVTSITALNTDLNFEICLCPQLKTVSAPNLVRSPRMWFNSNPALTALSFPALTKVYLPEGTSNNGFAAYINMNLMGIYAPVLTEIWGGFVMAFNPALTQLCMPAVTQFVNISVFVVSNNPRLPASAVQATLGAATLINSAVGPSVVFCNATADCDFTSMATTAEGCLALAPPPPPPPPPPSVAADAGTLNGEPCPVGGVCPGGGVVYPKAGYWNSGNDSGFVAQCEEPAEIRCAGGGASGCGVGYSGVLCGGCQDGYYARGTECVACAGESSQTALYVVTAVIFALLAVAHVVLDDSRLDWVISLFKWLQLLRVAGTKTGHTLPTALKEINDNLALVTFDYAFLRPSCIPGAGVLEFPRLFWGNAVVLVCLVAPPLLVLGGLALFHKSRRAHWINRLVRTLVVLSLLVYYVVATRTIQSVTCVKVGPYKVLKANAAEGCSSGAVLGIGALGLILFVITVPIASLACVGWLYYHKLLSDSVMAARYGYTYHNLRLTKFRFVFEAIQLVQLFLIALAWNSFPIGVAPYAFTVAVYALILVLIVVWRPFDSARKNGVMVLSTGIGFVSTVANLATLSTLKNTATTVIPVIVVMFVLVIGFAIGVYLVERRRTPTEAPSKLAVEKAVSLGSYSASAPSSAGSTVESHSASHSSGSLSSSS